MERYIEFVGNNPILFALLAVVIGLIVWTELRRFTRAYKEISPIEAVQLINHDNALMLDVREDAEITQGRIQGAKHIPLSVLKQRVNELEKFRDRPVVAYCRTGSRSGQAGNILCGSQFQKVYHMKGGIMAWESDNLPKSKK